MRLILASQSASRRAMLDAAGVPFEAMAAAVDEESAKASLRAEGRDARALADALAELKATKLSRKYPQDLVLGCDSTVALDDGEMIDKAPSRAAAADLLRRMAGTRHRLFSAAVICEGGVPVWRFVDVAKMHMRAMSDEFVDSYLDAEWPAISGCVGGYRIEGPGVQLFDRIEGNQFTIMGLPLLQLLTYLRDRGVMPR
ncbi:nucleoside triphosphate pyrophosphatase [Sphingomonas crocodyli]|uniref:Nucleoside triphosphate pyrophosphatase n=1 Tax=Sphingomonas crocodyli TaxID=1979270 RepID=A0A437M4M3_9SPHN|nr:nucleoside triphosphate pyrophosphatase [Sphingomonas crocodyli]RVT92629.1 septum formation protein Maf [Sphingomonas crocodyli]